MTPDSAGWSYVGFEVSRLSAGDRVARTTDEREVCVVMLAGQADIAVGSHAWPDVGSRASVFESRPDAVYAPPGQTLEIQFAVAFPDQLQSHEVHPGRAVEFPRGRPGKLGIIGSGKVSPDLRRLALNDVNVVQEPFRGG